MLSRFTIQLKIDSHSDETVSMDLHLVWLKPISLTWSKRTEQYELDSSEIPETAGVYIFGRGHGEAVEALYVGLAANLRYRIRQQLNNHRLMRHLERAKTGVRGVVVAEWRARPGQTPKRCLQLIEQSLIRHFVLKGHDLVNKNGASLRQHRITSKGRLRGILPHRLYLDKQ
jgi:hypothetical protein